MNDRHHSAGSSRFFTRLAGLALPVALATASAPVTAQTDTTRVPEVVVSASRIPVAAEAIGSAVTVITGDELRQRQMRTVAEALRDVPGLAVSRAGAPGSLTQVRIRGAEANHTLVLIDGVEVNNPSGGSEFNFGDLRAVEIDRIEILRGPQSAIYGSDAIGGVINIITRQGAGEPVLTMDAEKGTQGHAQIGAAVRGAGDGYHYALGLEGFRLTGDSIAPKSEGNTERDGTRTGTLNARFGFQPTDDLAFDFSGRYIRSTIESDSQPSVAGIIRTRDGDVVAETITRSGRGEMRYSMFGGQWTHRVSGAFSSKTSDTITNRATSFESDGDKTRLEYQTSVFFDTPSFANAAHAVTFLVERENDAQKTRSNFGSTDLDFTHNGYAVEYRVDLWERLFLSGSVRQDDNDRFDDATTVRFTAAYVHEPTDTRLHASYGTGVKNPTLTELFGFGPNFVANPNLQPEESRGYDIGIEQSFRGGDVVADVTYFNNRITNLIQGSGNRAVNLSGTSRIDGVELAVRAAINDSLGVSGQYTFTLAEDSADTTLVRRAKHVASANVDYTFADGRATATLGVDYNGRQRDSQFSNFFGTTTGIELGSFVLVNVGASYKLTDTLTLFGRVENLLDEDYQEVLGFDAPGIGAYGGVRATLF